MTKSDSSQRSTFPPPQSSRSSGPIPEILVGLVTPITIGAALGLAAFNRAMQQVSQVSESWFQGERLPSLSPTQYPPQSSNPPEN